MTSPSQNRALVLEAFDTLFNRRDYEAAARSWSPGYIQHSAHIPPGRDGLFDLVRALPPGLRYENAVAVADAEYVLLHGRFSGHARPRAWIAADVVRVENGMLAEHWDVLQDEASQEESRSGLPMFGDRFPSASAVAAQPELTAEVARRIVGPLYDALNQPAKKDVAARSGRLATRTTSPGRPTRNLSRAINWSSSSSSSAPAFPISAGSRILRVCGDQIIVRGEAAGTPVAEFFGARPTGRGFRTISLDVFTVRGEKLASAYHVENWVGAIQQIG